jgi:hypothetical protein
MVVLHRPCHHLQTIDHSSYLLRSHHQNPSPYRPLLVQRQYQMGLIQRRLGLAQPPLPQALLALPESRPRWRVSQYHGNHTCEMLHTSIWIVRSMIVARILSASSGQYAEIRSKFRMYVVCATRLCRLCGKLRTSKGCSVDGSVGISEIRC